MSNSHSWPLIGSIGAIVISPLLVLTTGRGLFYNFWLAIMMIALWTVQRLTKRELGIAIGDPKSYAIALAYAVIIIGCVALGARAAQPVDLKDYSAATVFKRLSLNFLVTFVLALITEEGFFRGALWESCERAGFSPARTVIWTSLAFGLWHFAVPIIDPDFAHRLREGSQSII